MEYEEYHGIPISGDLPDEMKEYIAAGLPLPTIALIGDVEAYVLQMAQVGVSREVALKAREFMDERSAYLNAAMGTLKIE